MGTSNISHRNETYMYKQNKTINEVKEWGEISPYNYNTHHD